MIMSSMYTSRFLPIWWAKTISMTVDSWHHCSWGRRTWHCSSNCHALTWRSSYVHPGDSSEYGCILNRRPWNSTCSNPMTRRWGGRCLVSDMDPYSKQHLDLWTPYTCVICCWSFVSKPCWSSRWGILSQWWIWRWIFFPPFHQRRPSFPRLPCFL